MMKNILLFAIILITAISCEKERKYHIGKTSTLKNGEVWDANNRVLPNDFFSQYFDLSSGVIDEFGDGGRLLIYKIPYSLGKYYLQMTPAIVDDSLTGASYRTFVGIDQTTGGWGLPEEPDSSNYINITFYDKCTKKIEGTFNMTLIGGYLFEPRDTIYFTNGRFEGKLSEN